MKQRFSAQRRQISRELGSEDMKGSNVVDIRQQASLGRLLMRLETWQRQPLYIFVA